MVPTRILVGIAGLVFVTVLTIYFWVERWHGVQSPISEAFTSTLSQAELNQLAARFAAAPTDDDAVRAHQTLLQYISNDFNKGIKFVFDFGEKFYGDNLPLRSDLDTRKLMDNYRNPLLRR